MSDSTRHNRLQSVVGLVAEYVVTGLIMLMMIIIWFGPEARNRSFLTAAESDA